MNVAHLLEASARREPGRTALVFGDRRVTYAELDREAGRVAAGLARLGIRRGERVPISQGYGLTESSPFATYNHEHAHRPGSVGTPIENVEVRVVDEHDREVPDGTLGEIVIRGPNVMRGYLGKPEDTAAALRGGWLHSGDIGHRDGDGYFHVVDRVKDMINVAGFKVFPREVEEVLFEHPAVAEAAVLGRPDPVKGEVVRACVVLRPGQSTTAEELIAAVPGARRALQGPGGRGIPVRPAQEPDGEDPEEEPAVTPPRRGRPPGVPPRMCYLMRWALVRARGGNDAAIDRGGESDRDPGGRGGADVPQRGARRRGRLEREPRLALLLGAARSLVAGHPVDAGVPPAGGAGPRSARSKGRGPVCSAGSAAWWAASSWAGSWARSSSAGWAACREVSDSWTSW